ncbi:LytTR family DNA-binding domain-containing protein [uncultured Croceitalea sp.]|uniref:LytR/AlgR family response regulator transcription factor n=1 Tax=uncultured Croceitalea sp. TaxID=1798908 RepID=UPI003305F945
MATKLKCIAVDDEKIGRDALIGYISKVSELQLIETFSNGLLAKDWLENNEVDIVFLDIQMPILTGLDMLRLIKNNPAVIFTTAYSEYALDGYEFNVIDYLLKPISLERFLQAVNKAIRLLQNNQGKKTEHLILKEGTDIVKIDLASIQYVEAQQNYSHIITVSRKYLILITLKELLKLLPTDFFYQVHRSFIVNLDKVDEIVGDTAIINGIPIPISKRIKGAFLDVFKMS